MHSFEINGNPKMADHAFLLIELSGMQSWFKYILFLIIFESKVPFLSQWEFPCCLNPNDWIGVRGRAYCSSHVALF